MQKCPNCKEIKELTCFYPHARGTHGYFCILCDKERAKQYAKTPAGKMSHDKARAKYAASEKGILKNRENSKNRRKNNPSYHNEYVKKRKKEDIQFKLSVNLRGRLGWALKKDTKSGSAVSDLGCSIADFKLYLESKFLPGMTWDNYGHTGWHIDHINPLLTFDLTNRDQFLQAAHYTNLQPIWAQDHYKKTKQDLKKRIKQ